MWGIALGLLKMLPGFSEGVFTWLNKKTDADLEKYKAGVTGDTAINVEEIRTRVALAQAGNETRKDNSEHWFTAWMVPAAFFVSLSHFAGVVFDSLPWFGHVVGSWRIPELPGQYAGIQSSILLTICGVSVVGSGIKRLFAK
jgi:hypothetical protein